ncbi:protein of unknown function [Methylorubrum extorquens]|uniref:Uncharacterized protein n=1 Tax=Methylorubrum extorquens TaxID=408 RepID=A0A2N9AVK9_METEX|nr:protein of unknown function [Methylorubrum extorquens]
MPGPPASAGSAKTASDMPARRQTCTVVAFVCLIFKKLALLTAD